MKCFDDTKATVIDLVNKQRDKDGISVRALSKIAGCDQSGLNSVLKKNKYPTTLDLLCRLLNGLGFTVTLQIKHVASGKETNIRLRK
jgi:hypothetical protein